MGVEKERGGWEWESWSVETGLDWVGVERSGVDYIVDDPSEEVMVFLILFFFFFCWYASVWGIICV